MDIVYNWHVVQFLSFDTRNRYLPVLLWLVGVRITIAILGNKILRGWVGTWQILLFFCSDCTIRLQSVATRSNWKVNLFHRHTPRLDDCWMRNAHFISHHTPCWWFLHSTRCPCMYVLMSSTLLFLSPGNCPHSSRIRSSLSLLVPVLAMHIQLQITLLVGTIRF